MTNGSFSREPYDGLHVEGSQPPLPGMEPDAPRIYPMPVRHPLFDDLSEEQLAVVFAMTSRRPEAFDEIARQVTAEKAADFHERWVLGYGHASVAEHAILHMAVENISRLACDALEDSRLASYTEKSSRYQVLPNDSYYLPPELEHHPELRRLFQSTCSLLFQTYEEMVDSTMAYMEEIEPQRENERDGAYRLRLRRQVTDSCRFLLPAATLTNVGLTINARVMEHLVQKLLSADLLEERRLGEVLKARAREITPTLVKYADYSAYIEGVRAGQVRGSAHLKPAGGDFSPQVSLLHFDPQAELKLATALAFRYAHMSYADVWLRVKAMRPVRRRGIIHAAVRDMGPFDAPPREFEVVHYTFELKMDYGALREFRRHRMQTCVFQPLTVENGYLVPPLLRQAGQEDRFQQAMEASEKAFKRLSERLPRVAQYVVTHAHIQRVLSSLNLRECYHLFRLRTQPQAHFSIREPVEEAMRLAVQAQPELFRYMRLRHYPQWWPFATPKNHDPV